jgi:hypothetical protein
MWLQLQYQIVVDDILDFAWINEIYRSIFALPMPIVFG